VQIIKKWTPVILIMMIIFAISSVPGQTVQDVGLGDDGIHITGHFLMFFILTLALFRATGNIALSIAISVIFALTDEFHQRYTPGRSASIKDVLTDGTASLAAGLLLWRYYPKLPAKLRSLLEK
jgi:VanZ family protein